MAIQSSANPSDVKNGKAQVAGQVAGLRLVVGKPIVFNMGVGKRLRRAETAVLKDWRWLGKKIGHSGMALLLCLAGAAGVQAWVSHGGQGGEANQGAGQVAWEQGKLNRIGMAGAGGLDQKHARTWEEVLEAKLVPWRGQRPGAEASQTLGQKLTRHMGEVRTQEKKQAVAQHLEKEYQLDPATSHEIVSNAFQVAEKSHVQPTLLLAMAEVESRFNPKAVSRAGAVGLVQVMPSAHPELVKQIKRDGNSLKQIKPNLTAGASILRGYIKRENGNVRVALQRYNGSLGDHNHRYAKKVLRAKARLDQLTARKGEAGSLGTRVADRG